MSSCAVTRLVWGFSSTMESESKNCVQTFFLTRKGLSPAAIAGENLDDVSRQLPDGTYTTLRTFDGNRFLRLDAHVDRLTGSARLLGKEAELDRSRLRQALADVLARTGFPESRLRITLPLDAKSAARAPTDAPVEVYISIEPFEGVDPTLYETGVRAITMLIARVSPRAKATGFIAPSRTLKAGLPREVYEVLMVTGDGRILEGFTSNFFAFLEGRLFTAGEGVLEGITRSVVLELAEEMFPVERRAPRVSEIAHFDEAFITSSSRGVLPVVVINEEMVGEGAPGPLTRRLSRRYDEYVVQAAKPPVENHRP